MVKTLAVRDARIDVVSEEPMHIVEEGPANSTYQIITTPSPTSTTSTTYMITPPSPNVGLCRYLRQKVSGTITITGGALETDAANILVALRAWPLASITSSINVQLNNSNIAYSQQNYWMKAYSRVANPYANQQTYQSGTATAPDVFNSYYDMLPQVQISPFVDGSAIQQGDASALSRVNQITSITVTPKTSAPNPVAAATMVIGFTITEPIICGPFVGDSNQSSALFGLNQVNITINWAPSLYKIISLASKAAVNITGVNVAFTNQQLLVNYVTPAENSLISRPIAAHYSCPDIRLYTNFDPRVVAPGSTLGGITTSTITLPRCPRMVILWATLPNSLLSDAFSTTQGATTYLAPTLTDSFLPISGVTLNAYDKSNLLGGAQPEQLYEMSLAAGLNATQAQFTGIASYLGQGMANGGSSTVSVSPTGYFGGAPLVIDFSNLSLPFGIAPGSDAQTQFQITFSVTNNYQPTKYSGTNVWAAPPSSTGTQVNMLVITDGILTLAGGASEWKLGGLTAQDVESAHLSTPFQSLEVNKARKTATLSGGSFWDTLKGVAKMALPIIGAVNPELMPFTTAGSAMLGAGAKKQPKIKSGYY